MAAIKFNSLIELIQALPDQESCVAYLETLRWGDNVESPYDETSKVYRTKKGYRCKNTGKDFNVLTGTIMQGTKIPLIKWLMAMWLLNSEKKGISSYNLSRKLNVSQNTAWYMLHRLRVCHEDEAEEQLSGVIEVDETFVGGKNKNRHWDKKAPKCAGRSFVDKTPVFGAIERGGKLYAHAVSDTKKHSLLPLIEKWVKKGATIYSDEWNAYHSLYKSYNHQFVRHGSGEYAFGDCCTNRIENFWSIFKRGIIGVYQMASRKHLQQYVQEFVYRFNTRKMKDSERFYDYLTRLDKRITYKKLTQYARAY